MTHDPRESAELEQSLLEHYRRHSDQAPPPALDARILAAAQAQAEAFAQAPRQPVRTPALSRLHGWLFGGSQRARWSMAFASIATLGIGVGLATRTLERSPDEFDAAPLSFSAPAPAPAPAVAPKAAAPAAYAPQKQAEKKAMAQESARAPVDMRKSAPPAIVSGQLNEQLNRDEVAAPVAPAPFADRAEPAASAALASKAKAAATSDEAQLQRSLREILQLQRNGQRELAKQQLHTLQQLYPQRDLSEELQRLQPHSGQQ